MTSFIISIHSITSSLVASICCGSVWRSMLFMTSGHVIRDLNGSSRTLDRRFQNTKSGKWPGVDGARRSAPP